MRSIGFRFDNTYARLPEHFFARLPPTPVSQPRLVRLNRPLADLLGLDADSLAGDDGVCVLAGNDVPAGAEPIAMAYAGHQFGTWVHQLGDGRAILLGEVVGRDGVRRDVQLKGAGRTPFSRMGDGRAALGPVLREYIVSEAMAALGIPTTRSLAAVTTGDPVFREEPLAGAVLTRVAVSHVRVGTFQYFAARGDVEAVRRLADYVIDRHYPHLRDGAEPYRALIEAVSRAQAELVARWLAVGFIHGVMNTDNMSVAGETIDFGPCAFLDTYHPGKVFSSIDRTGRYAYGNQPRIAHWNLACLAQALAPLLGDDDETMLAKARAAIEGFAEAFDRAWTEAMRRKLGLHEERPGDADLARDLLDRMAAGDADFTLTFRRLGDVATADPSGDGPVRDLFSSPNSFDTWAPAWRARLAAEGQPPQTVRARMKAANPARIPRNHRVEEAIAAGYAGDFGPFERLVAALEHPYLDAPGFAAYEVPPRPEEVVTQTFCGT